jgi:hypothetical protein
LRAKAEPEGKRRLKPVRANHFREAKTMGAQQPPIPQRASDQNPHPNASPATPSAPAAANAPPPAGNGAGDGLPYAAQPAWAAVFLAAALLIIFGTGGWFLYKKSFTPPGFTGGGAAAAAGILIFLALVLKYPTLIMDDSQAAGGEPSTMRILCLAVVLTFCLVMLRTGWNSGALPSIDGHWVWLVTAALGGKAVQKFAEVLDKS